MALSPEAEHYILEKVKQNEGYLPPLDPNFVQGLVKSIGEQVEKFIINQLTPVIITSPAVRRFVRQILEPYLPSVAVLSYAEIEPGINVNVIGSVVGKWT